MVSLTTRRVQLSVDRHRPAADTGRSPGRVLVVNGDSDLRAVLTRVLEWQGFRVNAVSHSGHALLLCRTTEFDVLIAELCGPDLSGPALREQVRRHCPNIAAVYLGEPGTPEGIPGVLVRPFTRDDLVACLHGALTGVTA